MVQISSTQPVMIGSQNNYQIHRGKFTTNLPMVKVQKHGKEVHGVFC